MSSSLPCFCALTDPSLLEMTFSRKYFPLVNTSLAFVSIADCSSLLRDSLWLCLLVGFISHTGFTPSALLSEQNYSKVIEMSVSWTVNNWWNFKVQTRWYIWLVSLKGAELGSPYIISATPPTARNAVVFSHGWSRAQKICCVYICLCNCQQYM